jgi:hypothetical protein
LFDTGDQGLLSATLSSIKALRREGPENFSRIAPMNQPLAGHHPYQRADMSAPFKSGDMSPHSTGSTTIARFTVHGQGEDRANVRLWQNSKSPAINRLRGQFLKKVQGFKSDILGWGQVIIAGSRRPGLFARCL